jgi:hypothetical protein
MKHRYGKPEEAVIQESAGITPKRREETVISFDLMIGSSRTAFAPTLLYVEAAAPYLPRVEGVEAEHAAGGGTLWIK